MHSRDSRVAVHTTVLIVSCLLRVSIYLLGHLKSILIYDYFVTLHSEVQWTWGRKWGIIRTAFTVSRYCAPFNDAVNGIHFLGIITSEGLLIARVYAFSGNKKAYLIILLSFGLAILVTCVILSVLPINLNTSEVAPPCVLEGARSSALPYGFLMLFEMVLMSTTAFLRYRHYLGSHSALMRGVYRDGLSYMFCIMMISTANVIVSLCCLSRIARC
ncbi:hypothetical protein EDB19DRAFT_290273 [Suillus lakei]|nr:hypothetical protein EDB19DRAFT_290273 [Suillus lakei]